MINRQDLQNMVATQQPNKEILGFLVWYSISEMFVQKDELSQRLSAAGITQGFMPKSICGADAFRKASSVVEAKNIPVKKDVSRNILVREVSRDKDHIQRNIVFEFVKKAQKKLSYKSEEAIVEFDKINNLINVSQCSSDSEPVVNQIKNNFQLFYNNYDSRAIRTMCTKYLWSLNPVSVRPSGSIYFVPFQYEEDLKKLLDFLKGFDKTTTEGHMVPLIDSQEQRDMVKAKIQEYLQNTLQSMSEHLRNPYIDKGNANVLLDSAKFTLANFRDYKVALSDELSEMDFTLELIQKQMISLIEKLNKQDGMSPTAKARAKVNAEKFKAQDIAI